MRRVILGGAAVAALLIGGFGEARVAQETEQAPGETRRVLELESETVRLGEVPSGTTLEATFVLRNTGEQPIKVLRAKPT